jgi:hypothetical protein
MMQGGLISPDVGRRLLDFPDLDAEEGLANATLDYLHMVLDNIVDNGKYVAPESDDNLTKAKELVLEYIAHAKLNSLAPEKLEKLRAYNQQIDMLTQPPAPPAGPGAPGAQPQAVPQPPPQSDLLPNVPGSQAA